MTDINKLITLNQLESCAKASKDYTDKMLEKGNINIITFTYHAGDDTYIPDKSLSEFQEMVTLSETGTPLFLYLIKGDEKYMLPYLRNGQGGVNTYQFATGTAENIYENPRTIVDVRVIVQVDEDEDYLTLVDYRRRTIDLSGLAEISQLRADINYIAMALGITLGGGN